MTKKQTEKLAFIQATLDHLFPNPHPPLHHHNAYTLLVSVLLSARCTDARVNQVTPALFALADNPFDMMKQDVKNVQAIIRPCGLSPQKSKGIVGLSKILVEKFNGEVPESMEELEKMPAVGHKTASVVMCQWFGKPAFPVDTHVHRLAYRWGLSSGKSVEKTEEDLKRAFEEVHWNKIHLQMVYYGRAYCPAKKHDWKKCPICAEYLRKEERINV